MPLARELVATTAGCVAVGCVAPPAPPSRDVYYQPIVPALGLVESSASTSGFNISLELGH